MRLEAEWHWYTYPEELVPVHDAEPTLLDCVSQWHKEAQNWGGSWNVAVDLDILRNPAAKVVCDGATWRNVITVDVEPPILVVVKVVVEDDSVYAWVYDYLYEKEPYARMNPTECRVSIRRNPHWIGNVGDVASG